MSRSLSDTYRRVQRAKGTLPHGATGLEATLLGFEWIERLYRPHGLRPDDFTDVAEAVAGNVVPFLLAMVNAKQLGIEEFGKACVGGGVSNGLIVGLEFKEPYV